MGGTQEQLAQRLAALREASFAGIDQLQIHVSTGQDGAFSPSEEFLREVGNELRTWGILFQTFTRTERDSRTFHRLLDLGCASFATDYPDAAMRAIREYYGRK